MIGLCMYKYNINIIIIIVWLLNTTVIQNYYIVITGDDAEGIQ